MFEMTEEEYEECERAEALKHDEKVRELELEEAKELLKIGMEGIKREFLFDGNGNHPFAQEAKKLCNQFYEQAEQFLKECEKC